MTTRRLRVGAGLVGQLGRGHSRAGQHPAAGDAAIIVDDGAELAAGVRGRGVPLDRPARPRPAAVAAADGCGHGGLEHRHGALVLVPDLRRRAAALAVLADVGFLRMPVLALPALLSLGGGATRQPGPPRGTARSSSCSTGWWWSAGCSSSPGPPRSARSSTRWRPPTVLRGAVAYPATDLILVVIVLILAVARRPLHAAPGWGCWGRGWSPSRCPTASSPTWSAPGRGMPPLNAGFIQGPC